VNPLPTVFANASPATICAGASSDLSASGASTYSWDNGLGAGATKTVTPSSTTTYNVTGTDINGCVNTASTTVTVNALPSAPTITAGGPTTFCAGGTVTLTSSDGSSYLWSTGAITKSIDVVSSGNFTVQITDINGCQSVASSGTAVTVNALPSTPTITAGGPTTFCAGGTVTLTSSDGSSYLWSTGAITKSIDVVSSGNFTVQINNGSDCQSPASDPLVVTIIEKSIIISSFEVTDASGIDVQDGIIVLHASGGSIPLTYTLNPGTVVNNTGIFIVKPDTYNISVNDENNCETVTSNDILVGYSVGIDNIASSKIELFPNPNRGKFRISYYDPVARSMNLEIFNILGVRVFNKEYKNKLNNTFSNSIELNDAPKGIYIIKINNKVYSERMIIR
jgi:large repetitive protein